MSSSKGTKDKQSFDYYESSKPNLVDCSNDDEKDSRSEEGDNEVVVNNKFANDGSFLELFKKMQQQQNKFLPKTETGKPSSQSINALPEKKVEDSQKELNMNEVVSISGNKLPEQSKRKPKVLKVGVIKKSRPNETSLDENGTDDSAWDRYVKQVRMYKQKFGDDEDKNRPLVK